MQKYTLIILSAFMILTSLTAQTKNIKDKPLRRSESFFGLHFDFHATENDKKIGETFTFGMADSMLSLINPDFIQVDCKGHPGVSSYPTKVGTAAPGFVGDPYKIWSAVTQKHKVGFYVHYSGVIDSQAAQQHPDWAMVSAKGDVSQGKNSVKGPYADELLIPQLKELVDSYNIDGAWIDGESWALEMDYSKHMAGSFIKETGITEIPLADTIPNWLEYKNYNRDSFRKYIRHYVDEMHKYKPGFQITSNWAFSSFMPHSVDIDVDFISGDFDPNNSLYSGMYEARCIASQGKPWDLMVWSFTHDDQGAYVTKSPVQLQQSAAAVISMGGGFQVYSTQNRDASLKPWLFELLKSTADFCRERQPYSQNAKPVPQIAVLYSTANFEKNSEPLYSNSGRINDPVKGIMALLLDGKNAVEILMEHHLEKRINEYPLVVIPETEYLEEDFRKILLEYVNNGGNLLIIGAKASSMFAGQLNISVKGEPYNTVRNIEWNRALAAVNGLFLPVELQSKTELYSTTYNEPDFRFPSYPAASVTSYGKGKIASVYFSMGRYYTRMKNPVYLNFLNGLVKKLFPDPIAEVSGSDDVAITVNRLEDKMMINLVNMSGPHNNIRVARYDFIPSVGPINIKIRSEKKPLKVTLQPGNTPLAFNYSNKIISTTIDKIDVHSIVVVE